MDDWEQICEDVSKQGSREVEGGDATPYPSDDSVVSTRHCGQLPSAQVSSPTTQLVHTTYCTVSNNL